MTLFASPDPNDWPRHLPRFGNTFRIFIEHPLYSTIRLLTSGPISNFYQTIGDYAPYLAKAGPLSFIASSLDSPYAWDQHLLDRHERTVALFWHWMGRDNGGWVIQSTQATKQRFADTLRIYVSNIDLPPTNGQA